MKLGFIFFLLINFSGLFAQTTTIDSVAYGVDSVATQDCEYTILKIVQSSPAYKEMVKPFITHNINYTLITGRDYIYTFYIDNTDMLNTIGTFTYNTKTKLLFQLDAAEGIDKQIIYDKSFTVNQNCN